MPSPSGPDVAARALTHTGALLALHVAVLLFGLAGLFGKWLALSPVLIVLGRTFIAAATLALILRWRGESMDRPSPALALNATLLAIHWVAFFASIQIASVAIGLLGFASFPLFVLMLDPPDASGGRRGIEWLTAALVTTGLVTLVPHFSWSDRSVQGLALGIASGFTFAWLAVRNRRLVVEHGAMRLAFWQNAGASLLLLAILIVQPQLATSLSVAQIALLIVLGALCTALAHTLFIASMQRVSAHTASVIAALEPVYGITLAAWLLGEIPDLRTVAGATLIVGAAIIASRRARFA